MIDNKINEVRLKQDGDQLKEDDSLESVMPMGAISAIASSTASTPGTDSDSDRKPTPHELKRMNRLAKNRESARNRRLRKKIRSNDLEEKVNHLNLRNQELMLENVNLKKRVLELEIELANSRFCGVGGTVGGANATSMLQSDSLTARTARSSTSRAGVLPSHLEGSGGVAVGGLRNSAELQYLQMQLTDFNSSRSASMPAAVPDLLYQLQHQGTTEGNVSGRRNFKIDAASEIYNFLSKSKFFK